MTQVSQNDDHQTLTLPKWSHVAPLIKMGVVTYGVFDIETLNLPPDWRERPYAIPQDTLLTEYAQELYDLYGRSLSGSDQVLFQRPDLGMYPDPVAMLVTNQDVDQIDHSPRRLRYDKGLAKMLQLIADARYAYGKVTQRYDDESHVIELKKLNAHMKSYQERLADTDHTNKEFQSSDVIVPLRFLDDNGQVITPVRWHVDDQMLSYRIAKNPDDPDYVDFRNNGYIDVSENEDFGTQWKYVSPRVLWLAYNARFDTPIIREQFIRYGGFQPQDASFMYSRGKPAGKQRAGDLVMDVMQLWRAVRALRNDLPFQDGERFNAKLGRIVRSDALSAILAANQTLLAAQKRAGITPTRKTLHRLYDPQNDHEARSDDGNTFALFSALVKNAPWLSYQFMTQAMPKNQTRYLSKPADHTKGYMSHVTPEIILLPHTPFDKKPTVIPCIYIGEDAAHGDHKKQIFLRLDRDITTPLSAFGDRRLVDLSASELTTYIQAYLEKHSDRQGGMILLKKKRPAWNGAIRQEDAHRQNLTTPCFATDAQNAMIDKNLALLQERLDGADGGLRERLLQAVGMVNRAEKNRPKSSNPLMEEQVHAVMGTVPYQQYQTINLNHGRRYISDRSRAIRDWQQRCYQTLTYHDGVLMDLACKTLPDDDEDEGRFIVAYNDLFKKTLEGLRKKTTPSLGTVDGYQLRYEALKYLASDFTDQDNTERVYPNFQSKRMVRLFQTELRQRILDDIKYAEKNPAWDYPKSNSLSMLYFKGEDNRTLLLLADPDNGRTGYRSFFRDQYGQVMEDDAMAALSDHDFRLVKDHELVTPHFWSLVSRPNLCKILYHKAITENLDHQSPFWRDRIKLLQRKNALGVGNEGDTVRRRLTLEDHIKTASALSVNAVGDIRIPTPGNSDQEGVWVQFGGREGGISLLSSMRAYYKRKWDKYHSLSSQQPMENHTKSDIEIPLDDVSFLVPRRQDSSLENDPNFITWSLPTALLRNCFTHNIKDIVTPLGRGQYDISLRRFVPLRRDVITSLQQRSLNPTSSGRPHVVLQEQETGRLYHPGKAYLDHSDILHRTIFEQVVTEAAQAYQIEGDPNALRPLAIEGLFPIASQAQRTQYASQTKGDILLGARKFDALTSPEWGNVTQPITAAVRLVSQLGALQQHFPENLGLFEGAQLDLKGRGDSLHADCFGLVKGYTGHSYVTGVEDVIGRTADGQTQGITLAKFAQNMQDIPEKTDDWAKRAGFHSAEQLYQCFLQWAQRETGQLSPLETRIAVILFDKVTPEKWHYRPLMHAPIAAFTPDFM